VVKNFLRAESPYSMVGVDNITGILGRCLLYFTALVVGGAFFAIVPKSKNILTRVGRNSFAVYVLHFSLVICVARYTNWLHPGLWRCAIIAVCSVGITLIFSLPVFQNLLSLTRRLPLEKEQRSLRPRS
jgi:fucose 4-O-acetylase-like acetyltransferase